MVDVETDMNFLTGQHILPRRFREFNIHGERREEQHQSESSVQICVAFRGSEYLLREITAPQIREMRLTLSEIQSSASGHYKEEIYA